MSMPPAPRSLFQRWIDDAAVFPPGNAPVPTAWSEHRALRADRYADLLGPLLVGASGAASLAEAAAAQPAPGPVDVGVIARAGTAVEDLLAAAATVRADPHLRLAAAELVHDDGDWRRALDLGATVAVEVPRDPAAQQRALDDVADAAASAAAPVLAKLRTQATATAPAPSARELAEFLLGARARDLPLKLTGGLHHAVAGATGRDEQDPAEHGALNVLVAVHHLEEGASLAELVATLQMRDGQALAALARGLDEEAVAALRGRFVSFGCCGVLDPIGELDDLGLLG